MCVEELHDEQNRYKESKLRKSYHKYDENHLYNLILSFVFGHLCWVDDMVLVAMHHRCMPLASLQAIQKAAASTLLIIIARILPLPFTGTKHFCPSRETTST